MGPRCDVFGPLGSRIRALHPELWAVSFQSASALAAFCGKVALVQMSEVRYFVNEEPYPSQLYRIAPWPRVRANPSCMAVVFHQCRVNQRVNGVLAKKPTELVSNSRAILAKFENLSCPGNHEHASLLGGRAKSTQKWSYEMCQRLAAGIEQQVLQSLRTSCIPEQYAFLSFSRSWL